MSEEWGEGVTLAILGMQKRRYDSLTELKIAAAREGRGSKARQKPARIHGNMIFFVPAWTAGSSLRSGGRGWPAREGGAVVVLAGAVRTKSEPTAHNAD